MNADRLLDLLVHTGALAGTDRTGALVLDRVPEHLATVIDRHRDELALAVHGRRTGHRWTACSTCHRTQLVPTGSEHLCALTPRCPGKLKILVKGRRPRPIGRDPLAGPTIEDDIAWLRCSRPGCTRVAEHLTAAHEPLCDLDHLLHALTAHQTGDPHR